MSNFLYTQGSTVVLHCEVVDDETPSNNPITGLTINASIRRTSDNKWYDFVAGEWDTVAYGSLAAEHKQALTDMGDGSYEVAWDQATADTSAERDYIVVYSVAAGVGWTDYVDQDHLVFSDAAAAPVADAVWEEPWHDHITADSVGELLRLISAYCVGKRFTGGDQILIYDRNDVLVGTFDLTPGGGPYTTRTPA